MFERSSVKLYFFFFFFFFSELASARSRSSESRPSSPRSRTWGARRPPCSACWCRNSSPIDQRKFHGSRWWLPVQRSLRETKYINNTGEFGTKCMSPGSRSRGGAGSWAPQRPYFVCVTQFPSVSPRLVSEVLPPLPQLELRCLTFSESR